MDTASTDPIINPETLQFKRACKDKMEAYQLAKRMVDDNKQRNDKNANILRQYNDPQPWDVSKMKNAGQAWRRNASTGFLSSIVRRLVPPVKQAVDTARVLTMAQLPDNEKSPEASQKTETFRVQFTRFLRKWKSWNDFVFCISLENMLYGYAAAINTDEWDWKPIFARQDEIFFPDACPQDASKVPCFSYRQNLLIHECANIVANPNSPDAGWNIENLVEAINGAKPEDRRSGTQENLRKYEDTIRETTMASSYSQGVKVVEVLHLFIQEANGKVSHYIFNNKDGKELFIRLDRFDEMADILRLLTVEVGNGKLHGSKGAGRLLYNTAVSIEQARNLINDNLYLSGLLLLKGSAKGKNAAAITVMHPVCVIGEDFEVQQQQFQVNVDAFFSLDRQMSQIAEMQVGAFMPSMNINQSGEKRTATEISYVSQVEQQLKEGVIARFFGQFATIVTGIQRRVFSRENIIAASRIFQKEQAAIEQGLTLVDREKAEMMTEIGEQVPEELVYDPKSYLSWDSIELCWDLMRAGLSPIEIYDLGRQPSQQVSNDMAQTNAQTMATLSAKYAGNPMINQPELIKRDIAATAGNDIAEALVIPQEDNTLQMEATRQQLIELGPLLMGEEVPVSPRDVDQAHLQVIMEKAGEVIGGINPEMVTPQLVAAAGAVLNHADAHLQAALTKKSIAPEMAAQFQQFIEQGRQMIGAGQAMMSQSPAANLQGVPPAEASTVNAAPVPTMPQMDFQGAPIDPDIPVIDPQAGKLASTMPQVNL